MRVQIGDKVWDKAAVQELLDRNPNAVAKALLLVYANQTADEQVDGETRHHNGIGFTGRDARFLTDVAQKYQRWGRWASERQLNAVRRAVKKYHGQILAEMAKRPDATVIKGRQTTRVTEQLAEIQEMADEYEWEANMGYEQPSVSEAGVWG